MKRISFVTLVLLLSMPFTANADNHVGFFAAAELGYADVDESTSINGVALDVDDDDVAWSIGGGYAFNEYFSVSGEYKDFGEFDVRMPMDTELDIDGFGVAAVGRLPIAERFDVHAKLGWFFWDAEVSRAGVNADDDDDDLSYGIGGAFDLTENWVISGDLVRYEIDDIDVDTFSVGLSYSF